MMRIEDYEPGKPAQVSTSSSGGRATLMLVREIRHSPEELWASLTDSQQVSKWAPFRPSHDLTELGPAVLKMLDGSTPEEYQSEVKRIIPNQLLEYCWGDSLLSWELAPSKSGMDNTGGRRLAYLPRYRRIRYRARFRQGGGGLLLGQVGGEL